MRETVNHKLLISGALLVLISFLTGIIIRFPANPRMALSAHQVALQAGMLLMIISLVWGYAKLSPSNRRIVPNLFILASFLIWGANILGSLLGTSMATPISGAGFEGKPWAEGVVSIVLAVGVLSAIYAAVVFFFGVLKSDRNT